MNPTPDSMTPPSPPAPSSLPVPAVSDLKTVERRAAYQSVQPVHRPSYWGVDLDSDRRPGVQTSRREPRPWPNTRFPPEPQPGEPTAPMHGRPNKTMPPVFGTAVPLRGLSGVIRRLAYRLPDHYPSHWMLMMAGDQVEAWGRRAWRYLPVLLPLAVLGSVVARTRRGR